MAQIWIPTLLRDLTNGVDRINVDGHTVSECVENLDVLYPGMRQRLYIGDELNPTLNIAIDGKVNRRRLKAKINSENAIHFIPAIAGG